MFVGPQFGVCCILLFSSLEFVVAFIFLENCRRYFAFSLRTQTLDSNSLSDTSADIGSEGMFSGVNDAPP